MTPDLGPVERLAIAYAPARLAPRYKALLALDSVLGRIAVSAREPLPAQLRLAWWREACQRIPNRGEHPVLDALAANWPGDRAPLAALVDAWEEVAVGERGMVAAAEAVAMARAAAFAACVGQQNATAVTNGAALIWTLTALSATAPEGTERVELRAAAARTPQGRLPRDLRPLAVLAGLARRALTTGRTELLGDRLSPLAAVRLGIFGR